MTAEKIEKCKKLLMASSNDFAKALLFYISKSDCAGYEKKSAFAEKLFNNYADIMSVSDGTYREYLIWKEIPDEISRKLISAYRRDSVENKKLTDEQLIAEMNEIF